MQKLTSVALGLSLMAACGSTVATSAETASGSTGTAVTRAQYDDTAQAVATTASSTGKDGDIAMSDSIGIALGIVPADLTLSGDGHYQGNRLGIDYNYDVSCTDATGNAVPGCGAATDKASVDVAVSGNLGTPDLSASLQRTGSWKVSGLRTTTATFNGDGNFSFDAMLTSVFRPNDTTTYKFATDAGYQNVIVATTNREPMSGTASFDVHASHTGTVASASDATFDVHADVTFNSDETATILLDGDQEYLLNMQSGKVTRTN